MGDGTINDASSAMWQLSYQGGQLSVACSSSYPIAGPYIPTAAPYVQPEEWGRRASAISPWTTSTPGTAGKELNERETEAVPQAAGRHCPPAAPYIQPEDWGRRASATSPWAASTPGTSGKELDEKKNQGRTSS